MSKVSLSNVPSNPRISKIRTISRTESEASCEEAARLTEANEDEDNGSLYLELPPPPDGGYGWVIVFASFMCNLVVDGIAYTFGVFLGEFSRDFNAPQGTVAWVGSLLSGVYLAVGPLVSALCNKFGCRSVCIAGALLASASFALSTLSRSVAIMMLTYGVMGGIGFGMIYLPSVVAVGYYFETRRSLATGIAVCGSGVGTVAFAPIAAMLLEHFDWRGANLILAGLILNCVIFGALMKPLEYPKESHGEKPLLQRMAEEKRMQMERGSIGGSYFVVQLPDGTMERRQKAPINIDPGVHSSLNLEQFGSGGGGTGAPGGIPAVPTLPTIAEAPISGNNNHNGDIEQRAKQMSAIHPATDTKISRNVSSPAFTNTSHALPKNGSVPTFDRTRKLSTGERFKPSLAAIKASSKQSISSQYKSHLDTADAESGVYNSKLSVAVPKESTRMVRPLSRKDIFYSGSVVNLPEYQSQKSLQGYRNSVLSLPQAGYTSRHTGIDNIDRVEQYSLCPCLPPSFGAALATMLDMSLLKDPVFLMIGISNVFGMAGLYIPFVYIIDVAKQSGIAPGQASFLVSVIGITNIFGRLVCGWIADFPWINSLLLNNICLIIATVSVSCVPLCSSYASYIAFAIAFGVAVSGYISLTSIILVDLLGLERLTNAFGLLILFRGVAAAVGSPLAGGVYDATHSYTASFLLGGGLFLLSTLFSFAAPVMMRFRQATPATNTAEMLDPIDEEDDDDSPITMMPSITRTQPSPTEAPEKNNITQRESVL